MHAALRKEFKNLKALAIKRNISVSLIETQIENVAFVSSGKKIVCLAIEEGEIHNMLNVFKVNLKKWAWAESEGFKLEDGLPADITEEILVKLQTPTEYLRYLGL